MKDVVIPITKTNQTGFLFLLIGLISLVSLVPSAFAQGTSYENPDGSFAINYPSDWQVSGDNPTTFQSVSGTSVVLMANDGLQYKIQFERTQDGSKSKEDYNQIIALVTFERGGTVQGQFTFKLRSEEEEQYRYKDIDKAKRIQTLHIEFIK